MTAVIDNRIDVFVIYYLPNILVYHIICYVKLYIASHMPAKQTDVYAVAINGSISHIFVIF
jgi:hypothetical protein